MALPAKNLIVLLITLASAGLFVTTLFSSTISATFLSNDVSVTPEPPAVASATGSLPERITIPKIEVDAKIEHVGLGKTGNMAVPLQYADVGWYRNGPKPGELGSAAIDGHVDNGLGIGAVFARLGELEPGDDIYIEGENGEKLHFVVEEEQTYALANVPLQKIFNRADRARLTLITCDGTWIAEQKMYDERHVVYAVLAG